MGEKIGKGKEEVGGKNGEEGWGDIFLEFLSCGPLKSYQCLKRSHLAWTSWNNIYKEINAFCSCILTAKTLVLLSFKTLFSDSHKPNFRKWEFITDLNVKFHNSIMWPTLGEEWIGKHLGLPKTLLTQFLVSVTYFLYFSILWTTYS